MDRADRRAEPLSQDPNDPGFRRRRALAILMLIQAGCDGRDVAAWFDLTPRRVRQIRAQAERFAQSMGFEDAYDG